MAYFHFFIFNRVADVVAGVNKNAREMSQKGGRKMSKKTGNKCPKKEDGKSKKVLHNQQCIVGKSSGT